MKEMRTDSQSSSNMGSSMKSISGGFWVGSGGGSRLSKKFGQGNNLIGNDIKVLYELDSNIKEDEREHLEEEEEELEA